MSGVSEVIPNEWKAGLSSRRTLKVMSGQSQRQWVESDDELESLDYSREGDGKLARGVELSKEHVGESVSELVSSEEGLRGR